SCGACAASCWPPPTRTAWTRSSASPRWRGRRPCWNSSARTSTSPRPLPPDTPDPMPDLLQSTLPHLEKLVSSDTRNPPRAIAAEGGIFDYLRANLPGFQVLQVVDHGAGAVSLSAVRGRPKYLFNVHLDTVPDSPHWSADPHVMRRLDDRVLGLGVCDIKG